uniref:Uncharacterized protein n=1 Tax=Rhizophora mucronata TaxID=61149 RepID=A0A2P2QA39_RHIMU
MASSALCTSLFTEVRSVISIQLRSSPSKVPKSSTQSPMLASIASKQIGSTVPLHIWPLLLQLV